MHGYSSSTAPMAGVFATNCCAKSPPSSPRRARAATCTPRLPTRWSTVPRENPTGRWWPPTTNRPQRHGDAASAYQCACADARRRGALAEARAYLNRAVTQLERCPPGPDRDRREIAARLQRGYLAAAARAGGQPQPGLRRRFRALPAAGRYRPARRACGGDLDRRGGPLHVGPRPSTGGAAGGCAAARCRRGTAVAGPRHTTPDSGVVAFLARRIHGRSRSFRASHHRRGPGGRAIDPLWSIPLDSVAWSYVFLAVDRVLHGDLTGAEARLTQAVRRAEQLGFPAGPYNRVCAGINEIWIRCEAGQLDRARQSRSS